MTQQGTTIEMSSFHDEELMTVSVDRTRSIARLEFRLEDGALRTAELHGLKAFRGEDLTLQNVVSRVLQSSQKEISTAGLEHWITWVTSLSDADSWLNEKRKHEWFDSCVSGSLDLVVFEPSAGAQFVAVCEKIILS